MVEQTTTKNEDKIEKLQTFDSSFFKIQFFFFGKDELQNYLEFSTLSGLRQFLATKTPLKMMKNLFFT